MIVVVDDFTTSRQTVRIAGEDEGISKVLILGSKEVSALCDILQFVHWEEARLKRPEEVSPNWEELYLNAGIAETLREFKKAAFG